MCFGVMMETKPDVTLGPVPYEDCNWMLNTLRQIKRDSTEDAADYKHAEALITLIDKSMGRNP